MAERGADVDHENEPVGGQVLAHDRRELPKHGKRPTAISWRAWDENLHQG